MRERDEPVRLTRIYTRGGDRGETSLGDGSRVSKLDCRIGAFGFRPCGLDRAVLRFPFADIAEDGNHLTLAGPGLAGKTAHVHPSKLAGAAPDAKLQ